jgi:hypothetical protein
MYLLDVLNFCETSGVLRVFQILKIAFSILTTVLPIIVIISFMIDAFKVVSNGKSDSLTEVFTKNVKRLISALIVFLLPSLANFIFTSLVSLEVDFASCWTNATTEGIEQAMANEEQAILEEQENRKNALLEAAEDRAKLDAAKIEIIKQDREEYNNGGALEGEILSSGTQGEYFAPFQGGSHYPSGASTTGGCSNSSPVYHDISASIGTPVYAPYDGTAKYIQSNCNGVLYSFGNQVRVYKEDGTYITYAHFSKYPDGINMPITKDCTNKSSSGSKCGAGHCTVGMTSTKVAEVSVKKGQLIGYTGTTGNSLGPHLHVEIHEKGSSACVTDPWKAFGMR